MEKLVAIKKNMTQIWKGERVVPVTVLELEKKAAESELAQSLQEGDIVHVSGISRGNGFQGVVKRHGFHGGPKSHGQKDRLLAAGSPGPTAPPRGSQGGEKGGQMGAARGKR